MQFSIVVPLIPGHDKKILRLFQNLSKSNASLSEIIIARSETKDAELQHLTREFEKLRLDSGVACPVLLATTPKKCLAGENRNRGWMLASSEWVSFLDADDLYLPEKFLFQETVIRNFPEVNLIIHNFYFESEMYNKKSLPEVGPIDLTKLVHDLEIFEETFGLPTASPWSTELESTNLRIPGNLNIHHGHASVRNELRSRIRFKELPKGEDGIFCQEILRNFGGVIYIPAKLSIYLESESSLSIYSFSGRLQKLKSAVKQLFLKMRP